MTFQRFMNRNRLTTGDYEDAGEHRIRVNTNWTGALSSAEFAETIFPAVVERLHQYENEAKGLLGDLRRLERDVADEGVLCQRIAQRTGIDPGVVAVVLKEFLTW